MKTLAQRVLLFLVSAMLVGCSFFTGNSIKKTNNLDTIDESSLPKEQWLTTDAKGLPLSFGDRLRVLVNDDKAFSGVFEVNIDGHLHIPYLNAVPVVGLSVSQTQQALIDTLIEQKMYQVGFKGVSVKILQWSKIYVFVQGAVFNPGRVLLNDKLAAQQSYQQTQESGNYSIKRFLTFALKGAGGIQPNADLSRIRIIRKGKALTLDVSGILKGSTVVDIPLIAGDQVFIPSLGKIDPALIRPSQITPPGFQVFMSNLSQPSTSNAQSSVSKASRSVPYGTRLLEGAMAANCIGGSWINSSRKVLYSTKDLVTREAMTQVFDLDEVAIKADQLEGNPYLMPNDGIACFDSDATNIREVAKYLGDILDPVAIAKLLFLL